MKVFVGNNLEKLVRCLAVPLIDLHDTTVAALAMIGPDFRMQPPLLESELLPRLKDAGQIISSKLGYLGPHLSKDLY